MTGTTTQYILTVADTGQPPAGPSYSLGELLEQTRAGFSSHRKASVDWNGSSFTNAPQKPEAYTSGSDM